MFRSRPIAKFKLVFGIASVISLALAAAVSNIAWASPSASTAWNVSLVAQPTSLPLTQRLAGEPRDQYAIALTNIGSLESVGSLTLTDILPPGVTVKGGVGGSGWECPQTQGAGVVTCTYSGVVPPLGQASLLTIRVAVENAGPITNRVTVSGGSAASVEVSRTSEAGAATLPFEILDFSSQASGISGAPDELAADHPFALTTTLDFPQFERNQDGSPERPLQNAKALNVEIPVGMAVDLQAAQTCRIIDLYAKRCPPSSQVGAVGVDDSQGLFAGYGAFPIYNVVPEHGYPAEFGVLIEGIEKAAFMYGSVGAGPEYKLHLAIPDIPSAANLANAIAIFYGDPQAMDHAGNSSIPFFTNPSDCSGEALQTEIEAESWEELGHWVQGNAHGVPVSDCGALRFQPALIVSPDSPVADEPAGYNVEIKVPQAQADGGLEGRATPDVKDVATTLPTGVALSPGAADGLVACPAEGPEGINLTAVGQGHCPVASQIGIAEAQTPLLAELAHGHIYVAMPSCGGENQEVCGPASATDGSLFGLYLELEDSGVIIKQHGTASVNPTTGQISASFKNAPQLPFDDLKLTLKGGPRAPLSNPQTCGEALTTSDMTPWSSPDTPDSSPMSAFSVTGCEGSPFAPAFESGTTNTAAGAYTNFTTTFSRSDRQQDLSTIQVRTPPGLLGVLAHVALCGEPQATAGTCSAASRIGTASASAGAGSHPFWVSGPVYLTGPYNGAPFGLSVPIQAKAGPFNLGTIVTRAMLNVDPSTSALTVTSDPLPQIWDGVPLRVQTVNVTVDKSQFMFNPTNCEAKQITATIASAQNAVAHVSSPFAAGGCKNLPFNPGFKVATRAPGSKKKGTSLDVKVSSEPGQANIHSISVSLPKQLPSRLTTIQQACPEATFAANPATCPAGSLIGVATGTTPVLSVPVTGPAYLVSHGGAAFPDLKLILQAEGVRVDLTGSINIKGQITSSTFASIPDVPISSFELKLPEGPHSALTPNGSLCAKPLVMPTTIVGQNGRRLVRSTKVAVAGCPKKKPTPKPRKKPGK